MGSIQGFVPYWNDDATEFANHISRLCGIRVNIISGFSHEAVVLNKMIDACQSDYLWFLQPDNEIIYEDTPHVLAEYLDKNPQVGVVQPDLNGEFPGWRQPEKWYLRDSCCMMVRMGINSRFDTDFIFTGWGDLDFGNEVEWQGFEVHLSHNVSVRKGQTKYGDWSAFRQAYNARNRLLLEAKWYWVGRGKWAGVDVYNMACESDRRIPTMFELAWWGDKKLKRFAKSVNMEHPYILMKDDQGTGNLNWRFLDDA
jgi:hypothetical protein